MLQDIRTSAKHGVKGDRMRLQGKVALITGSANGMGSIRM